jgi:hypothetical protein
MNLDIYLFGNPACLLLFLASILQMWLKVVWTYGWRVAEVGFSLGLVVHAGVLTLRHRMSGIAYGLNGIHWYSPI